MKELTYATVCSGIECMSVASWGLPLKPVFFSEIEPFPCAVLKAHYSRICHQRYLWDGRWTVVASMAMGIYDYMMSVLRKRENAERREKIRKRLGND